MNDELPIMEKQNDSLLAQIVYRYLPFWPFFIIIVSISLAVSFIILRSQTKIYLASSKVLLKDPQKGNGDTKVLDALNIFSEKKTVENEIIVLRSTSLMETVVKDLDLYAVIFNEGKVQKEELYGSNSPLKFVALHKDSISPAGKRNFEIDWESKMVKIDGKSVPFGGICKIQNTHYRIEINPNYKRNLKGKNYFVVFNSVYTTAAKIISTMKAGPISYASTVIDVKMETAEPKKGADILNKLFEVYNKAAIEDKNLMATKTLNFIEDRLSAVINQLDSVEKNMETYKTQQGVLELGEQASIYFNVVNELDKANSTLDLQLQILQEVEKYTSKKSNEKGTVPSLILLNDETLKSLLNQLYTAEFELEAAYANSGRKSNTVLLAEEKVEKLKVDIKESLSNIRSNLSVQRRSNDMNIARNKNLYSSVPMKERGLLDISRQQAIKNEIYTYLLKKREETALSSASTSADLRVLEKGSVSGPISPIPTNYFLTGFLIGLLIFVMYVQGYEQFNNKVMFRAEIEKRTKVPVIGEIVQSKINEPIAIGEGKRTVIAEQLRALRTNLNFMGLNEDDNVLLVTSSISGEGKSFVSVNLAISLTLNGKKVALLEMDLRKPKLSKTLELKRDIGISTYLVHKNTLEEIIRPTSFENLYLLSAGPIPPNPTELISKPEFKIMIDSLKSQFDYVIIDTAPCYRCPIVV
jgi:tyrosine-protein kinase Etk/Wzc